MAQIIEMAVGDVVPYENNPRNNDMAVDKVAESIKEFGFQSPIIVDRNNVIIAGHTRLKAAEKLGLKKVPVIVAKNLTEEQARAFRLADNKTGELAEWEYDKLTQELNAIEGIDMTAFGFEELENALTEYNIEEDEFEPEVPEEPKTKLGDIYELGDHRLMCGDSTSEDDLKKLVGGGRWLTWCSQTLRMAWRSVTRTSSSTVSPERTPSRKISSVTTGTSTTCTKCWSRRLRTSGRTERKTSARITSAHRRAESLA